MGSSLKRTNREISGYIFLIVVFIILLLLQVHQIPLERFGSWDVIWVDSRGINKLENLRVALRFWQWPAIDLHTNFGWNLGGDIFSVWSFPNLLVSWLSLGSVLFLRYLVMLVIGGVGVFLLFRQLLENSVISFCGTLVYLTVPLFIGLYQYDSAVHPFFCFPWVLLAIHNIIQRPSKLHALSFWLVAVGTASVSDFNAVPIFFAGVAVYTFLFSYWVCKQSLRGGLCWSLLLTIVFVSAGLFYYAGLFENLSEIKAGVAELRTVDGVIGNYAQPVHFLSFLYRSGYTIGSLFFPIEGPGLVLYSQPWLYCVLGFAFKNFRAMDRSEHSRLFRVALIILAWAFLMVLEPLAIYNPVTDWLIPSLKESSRGIMRYQMNLIPIAMILSGVIVLSILAKMNHLMVQARFLRWVIGGTILTYLVALGHYLSKRFFYLRPYASSSLISPNHWVEQWPMVRWIPYFSLPLLQCLFFILIYHLARKGLSSPTTTIGEIFRFSSQRATPVAGQSQST